MVGNGDGDGDMGLTLPCGLAIERGIGLAPLTSWTVGGPADFLAQPKSPGELAEVLAWGRLAGLPITILGGGTNVLISDRGVRGLTIALRKMASLEARVEGDRLRITCLAGTSKSELLKTFLKHKLEPALFLAGLPGDVGGGITMNAGVGEMIKPREFVEITEWIEVMRWPADNKPVSRAAPLDASGVPLISPDLIRAEAAKLETVRIEAGRLEWKYRHCEGWRPGVIVRVGIQAPNEPKDDILQRVKSANQVRLSKQPLDMPSCGSVFVNPSGHKSGQLIESNGLKGFAVGGAKVSEKHANFIVNFDKAKALDIHRVIEHVRKTVHKATGVALHTEVIYVGEWSPDDLKV